MNKPIIEEPESTSNKKTFLDSKISLVVNKIQLNENPYL